MRALFDTNVLLDVIQVREPHHAASERVWTLVERAEIEGFVAAISFNNIYYVLSKQIGRDAALKSVRSLSNVFRFVPFDEQVLNRALLVDSVDFEDAIQSSSAESVSANYIVTRNVKHFASSPIEALTPEEFLFVLGT
jgi:predicted nucleic acid-binding protein